MRWALGSVACLALAAMTSCSAIVAGDGTIRCERGTGADPCPSGLTCSAEGVCVGGDACQVDRDHDGFNACNAEGVTLDCDDANPQIFPGAPEQCNGNDDNCNLSIDEEQQDLDGDGYTRCGSPSRPPDCDDEDPERNPGAAEICDNVDNNCNGLSDEDPVGTGLCGAGALCVAGRGCVALGCAAPGAPPCASGSHCDTSVNPATCLNDSCTTTSCTAGQRCNRDTGACESLGTVGAACVAASDCASGVCTRSEALNLPSSSTTTIPSSVCSQACCRSSDCSNGQICWDGGRGARSCLPPALVGTSVGPGAATAACTTGGDCASGVCATDVSLCVAGCSLDGDCGSLTCAPVMITADPGSDRGQLACTASSGGKRGDSCAGGADCAVRICFPAWPSNFCSGPCGTSSDCGYNLLKCSLVNYGSDTSWAQICRAKQTIGLGTQGSSCTVDSDCHDERCVRGICANTCCTQANCPSGTVCAASQSGSHWEMRCGPAAG